MLHSAATFCCFGFLLVLCSVTLAQPVPGFGMASNFVDLLKWSDDKNDADPNLTRQDQGQDQGQGGQQNQGQGGQQNQGQGRQRNQGQGRQRQQQQQPWSQQQQPSFGQQQQPWSQQPLSGLPQWSPQQLLSQLSGGFPSARQSGGLGGLTSQQPNNMLLQYMMMDNI
ncbi:unnamed protein product [Lymnaea stagnalis]|uniref:Uncharacterized protein n=1 Tax=Lymnaea stagnalis TaxID=6523 RepID=A0AAV2HAE3_LYMST